MQMDEDEESRGSVKNIFLDRVDCSSKHNEYNDIVYRGVNTVNQSEWVIQKGRDKNRNDTVHKIAEKDCESKNEYARTNCDK